MYIKINVVKKTTYLFCLHFFKFIFFLDIVFAMCLESRNTNHVQCNSYIYICDKSFLKKANFAPSRCGTERVQSYFQLLQYNTSISYLCLVWLKLKSITFWTSSLFTSICQTMLYRC